ncbi:NADH-quinone oxidoreductase subunit NuoK [bacterium]|nr:NADH-quinone oxidoreductase subunit NuoK [bacterium]
MQEITMLHYLFISMILFVIGILGIIFSKHVIKVLISIEFILTAVNLNFITFATFLDNANFEGYILSLFYVAIGAVELAVALYIFYLMYDKKKSENLDKYGDL